ncbi:hypothetical protein BRAS3809_6210004 [Bradyrhizobium sp. STM 3809]|nr:hypothetical protein BRAS3809_6210004 [Bradyrhizobium sp. STM 3809]
MADGKIGQWNPNAFDALDAFAFRCGTGRVLGCILAERNPQTHTDAGAWRVASTHSRFAIRPSQ